MDSELDHKHNQIEIKVPCRPEFVRTVRRAVADFAQSLDVPESMIAEIEVAASEAVTNIVRHAYDADEAVQPLRVKCKQRANGLTLEVIDKGRGFNAPPDGVVPDVDLDCDGGFGIALIKTLMDRVNYVSTPDEGTKIRMTKRAKKALTDAARRRASDVGPAER